MDDMSTEQESEEPHPETEEVLDGQVGFKGLRKLGTLLDSDHGEG